MKLAATIAAALVCALPATASAMTAAERGAAVVEEWCRDCHQRPGEKRNPSMAPPHDELVRRPGRNRAYFEKFMREDHFPMTIYRLFENEKQDVVEYLLSLQKNRQNADH
ncbi:MAG: hypothetical protein MUE79_07270 [Nitratireductor sp.]|jgi:mono/diheme cytochrome c family protein|nr:hypothetical protein [Nitratireductor sp.]